MSNEIIPHQGAEVVRHEFAGTEVQRHSETAAEAVAAREQAVVQARYIVALKNRRDMDEFRVGILRECKRPGFAEKVKYARPQGKRKDPATGEWVENVITGPTIRFVEAALRHFRNIHPEVVTVYDSATLRICRVSVGDLESNLTYTTEVQIQKAVERKGVFDRKSGKWEPPRGREVISERLNSYGEPTYLVIATDDELLAKQNAQLSKAIRTNALRLLPGDIVAEALDAADATLQRGIKDDPETHKRKLIDSFAELGIGPDDLKAYIGHSLDRVQPAEIAKLRAIWTAIRDGETTWAEVVAESDTEGSAEELEQRKSEKVAAAAKGAKATPKAQPQVERLEAKPAAPAPAAAVDEMKQEDEPWPEVRETPARSEGGFKFKR